MMRWSPSSVSIVEGLPPGAAYRSLAFSPDGKALWASPVTDADEDSWEATDILDLTSGTVGRGPRWDTGVVVHPAGGLAATLCSDQGQSYGVFARLDRGRMRILRQALILAADGYETPIFSPDGRHFAIRGNSYEHSLEVFEFPSLVSVLATTLGTPCPQYPPTPEWREEMDTWSHHNVAFGRRPGVLWLGTPTGTLDEIDLETMTADEHHVLPGSRVTAMGTTATGDLIVAGSEGDLLLLSVSDDSTQAGAGADLVAAFLNATKEIPDGADLDEHLMVDDGLRSWGKTDRATVRTAAGTAPTWLHRQPPSTT